MKFVILTGMSGAGKSTALKIMEDIGYFCVDNLPIALIIAGCGITESGCRRGYTQRPVAGRIAGGVG